jgi:hypothetical protein
MAQTSRNIISKPPQKASELEVILAGILGLALVIVGTVVVYYLISNSAPWDTDDVTKGGVHMGLWVGGILGTMFFIWGAVGVLTGKIVVGWGTVNQVRTTVTGAGAFVASIGTILGGVLFLSNAVISLIPEVGTFIHPLAALLSGFVSIILGWILGVIIRALGY